MTRLNARFHVTIADEYTKPITLTAGEHFRLYPLAGRHGIHGGTDSSSNRSRPAFGRRPSRGRLGEAAAKNQCGRGLRVVSLFRRYRREWAALERDARLPRPGESRLVAVDGGISP